MSGLTLRVVWPIVDPLLSDQDAILEAWADLPSFAEHYQVTVSDRPRMWVKELDIDQARAFKALRAVVCEAPVVRRLGREALVAA